MNPILSVEGITFRFGNKPVLTDISLAVDEGDYLTVLGPNGSGKSTLLRLILGILNAQSGVVKLGGRLLCSLNRKEIARNLAYVPQAHFKQTAFTVAEYLKLARYPYNDRSKRSARADILAVETALHDTGILSLENRKMNSLSGGELQKALIAAAVAQEAPILLLDEASAFLDLKHKTDIERLLSRLNRDGKTIVSVSHDINGAALTGNRIIALKEGRKVFDGSAALFMTHEVVQHVFEEECLFVAHPLDGRKILVRRTVSP